MTQEKSANKTVNRAKPFLMILAFVVTLFLLLGGIMRFSNWNRLRPYKTLASELNKTLGGDYETTNTESCSIDTPNCPNVRLSKEGLQLDLESARKILESTVDALIRKGYSITDRQNCVYKDGEITSCGLSAVNGSISVTQGVGGDFVLITIGKK